MYEEKILTCLVENYRKSKKDAGKNKTNRRTQVKPEKLYRKYRANDGDFEEISKLNQAAEELSKKGFVTRETETFGTQLQCICLIDERVQDIERYLTDKYGYTSKDRKLEKLQELVVKYQNASSICKKECAILAECVENRKIPKNIEELDNILKAAAFIEENQEDLYIRETSMKIYGDSKFFENETLQPVCSILRKYSDRNADDELSDEILLDYHIAKEPQKLCTPPGHQHHDVLPDRPPLHRHRHRRQTGSWHLVVCSGAIRWIDPAGVSDSYAGVPDRTVPVRAGCGKNGGRKYFRQAGMAGKCHTPLESPSLPGNATAPPSWERRPSGLRIRSGSTVNGRELSFFRFLPPLARSRSHLFPGRSPSCTGNKESSFPAAKGIPLHTKTGGMSSLRFRIRLMKPFKSS